MILILRYFYANGLDAHLSRRPQSEIINLENQKAWIAGSIHPRSITGELDRERAWRHQYLLGKELIVSIHLERLRKRSTLYIQRRQVVVAGGECHLQFDPSGLI